MRYLLPYVFACIIALVVATLPGARLAVREDVAELVARHYTPYLAEKVRLPCCI